MIRALASWALVAWLAACGGDDGGTRDAAPPECESDADCTAAGPCAAAQCTEGRCEVVAAPDGTPCSTGTACTVDETCMAGACGGGTRPPPDCGGRMCGTDVCGSSCGECAEGERCGLSGTCVEASVERMPYFLCQDGVPADGMRYAGVRGASGESVWLVPADGDCLFHLEHRVGTTGERLTADPGGYATVVARAFDGGRRAVCASDVRHHVHPDADPAFPPLHEIDGVVIRCWVNDGSDWSEAGVIVPESTDWAAWTADVTEAADAGTYVLRYGRDFTFQLLNFSNHGRPVTDGLWDVPFGASGGGAPAPAGDAAQASEDLVPDDVVRVEQWEPTDDERAAAEPWVDFGEGPCAPPDGCPGGAP